MKYELEIPDLPEAPKYHEYQIRGVGWRSETITTFCYLNINDDKQTWIELESKMASGFSNVLYAELVRTHNDDGTPIDILPLPELPPNVEKIEYFGKGLTSSDFEKLGGDNYIYFFKPKHSKSDWRRMASVIEGRNIKEDDPPAGNIGFHYAIVYYKKPDYGEISKGEAESLINDYCKDLIADKISWDVSFLYWCENNGYDYKGGNKLYKNSNNEK